MPTPAPSAVPKGMHSVTTQLWYNGNCSDAIEFYQKAFGANVIGDIARGPDGKSVMHSVMQIGDSMIMMSDAWPGQWEMGPKENATAGLFIYTEDCDALMDQAVAAGCDELFATADMFWGDRMGKVKDPFGHCWGIATHKLILTDEEIAAGQREWMKSMGA